MNEHQYRHSDKWEPNRKDIKARTFMGQNCAEILIKGNPNTRIRSTQLYQLGDWV